MLRWYVSTCCSLHCSLLLHSTFASFSSCHHPLLAFGFVLLPCIGLRAAFIFLTSNSNTLLVIYPLLILSTYLGDSKAFAPLRHIFSSSHSSPHYFIPHSIHPGHCAHTPETLSFFTLSFCLFYFLKPQVSASYLTYCTTTLPRDPLLTFDLKLTIFTTSWRQLDPLEYLHDYLKELTASMMSLVQLVRNSFLSYHFELCFSLIIFCVLLIIFFNFHFALFPAFHPSLS